MSAGPVLIVAVDVGATSGYCIFRDGRIVMSGEWDIRPRANDSPGMRHLNLRRRLEDVFEAYGKPTMVAYEQPNQRGGWATEALFGDVATIKTWCAERQVSHHAVHIATLKKWAAGHGRADKAKMRQAAARILEACGGSERSWEDIPDNEADAVCIAAYADGEVIA